MTFSWSSYVNCLWEIDDILWVQGVPVHCSLTHSLQMGNLKSIIRWQLIQVWIINGRPNYLIDEEQDINLVSKYLIINYQLTTKEKPVTLQWRNLADITLIKWSMLVSTIMGKIETTRLLMWNMGRNTVNTYAVFLPKVRNHQMNLKWGTYDWPVFFKNVKIIKD